MIEESLVEDEANVLMQYIHGYQPNISMTLLNVQGCLVTEELMVHQVK